MENEEKQSPRAMHPAGTQAANAPLIRPEELQSWIVEEDADFLAFNKPGHIVCHPSKNGPWSSLAGAVREWTACRHPPFCAPTNGAEQNSVPAAGTGAAGTVHLVSRLDRETSGIILVALNREAASKSQTAIQRRHVSKTYLAILEGEMREPRLVDAPLCRDFSSPVLVKQCVGNGADARTAVTFFEPLFCGNGYTLARVELHTGRQHQIRVHAQHIGHCVAGDKLYGHDERLYLEFCTHGQTERLARELALPRQALHAARLVFKAPDFQRTFSAPLAGDLRAFCLEKIGVPAEVLDEATALPD